jgi:hypothetical protein
MLAKSGMIPQQFKTPQSVLAVILRGQELGITPMQSLEMFNFIQGKVTMSAAGLVALCQSRGGKFEVLEETDKACAIRATRPDRQWVQEYRFSIEDAHMMGLTGKDNWKKMPRWMLYARCVSVLCRRGWADILGGLYSSEEMRDSQAIEIEPVREAVNEDIPQVVQPEASTSRDVYRYDISPLSDIDPEQHIKARQWAFSQGAALEEETGYLTALKPLTRLVKYEVRA